MTDLTARSQSTEGGCSTRDDSLIRRITEILREQFPLNGNDTHAHVAALITAEFRREEREIDYGLGSLGTEKRTQVRYTTPWETQP